MGNPVAGSETTEILKIENAMVTEGRMEKEKYREGRGSGRVLGGSQRHEVGTDRAGVQREASRF